MTRTPVMILIILSLFQAGMSQTRLVIKEKTGYQIIIESTAGGELAWTDPAGFCKVFTAWSANWPDSSVIIPADSLEIVNGYTLLHGSAHLKSGIMKVRDAWKKEGDRHVCTRRWEWHGTDTLRQVTLNISLISPEINARVVMPGILYHGNPAGKRSGRTPVLDGVSGELALFEEHRFPMPFVSREWGHADESASIALHSLPCPVPYGNIIDQWWSMGIEHTHDHTRLCLYSGAVGFNQQKSVIKAFQGYDGMTEPYDNAWINLPPGAVVEKTFYVEGQTSIAQGSGFQQAVESSLDIFSPWEMHTLPDYDDILTAKLKFAASRYYEEDPVAGFKKYPDRNYLVLGWCGQAMAPGYAMQVLSKTYAEARQSDWIQKSLDFLSGANFYDSGFYTWYHIDNQEWFMNHTPEWLSQGQAMLNMANAIRVADPLIFNTNKWRKFLLQASDFHAKRILALDWKPESTNEGFFIAPLVLAHELFGEKTHLEAAQKAARYYADLYLDMNEVYWGGTLDASCEDKEGAFAALQGFIELYDHTGDPEYLIWARHAGDVCLSYLVVWDIPLPPGRLTDHGFKTRGWTAVSVQNMHIDVYGVLIAPYIFRLGKALNKSSYAKAAELMFRSCGQLIDPYGSQGEQPYQTNYIQTNWKDKPVWERRGNYLETWTVFWITAHFLNAGAMFMEMGVI